MPVKKFLEIDSTYRNRNLFQNPAEFVVNISQGTSKSQLTAVDPVSDAYPDVTFSPDDIPSSGLAFTYVVASGKTSNPTPLTATSSGNLIILGYNYSGGTPLNPAFLQDNYFCGLVLLYAGESNIMRRITGWSYSETDIINDIQYFLCELDENITDSVEGPSIVFTVYNPSSLNAMSFFIPFLPYVNNFYTLNYILWNQRTQTFAPVINFDNVTHIAKTSSIPSDWQLSDAYVIRKRAPVYVGTLTGSVLPSFPNSVDIGVLADPGVINSFLRIFQNVSDVSVRVKKIISIVGLTSSGQYTTNLTYMKSYTNYVILENTDGLPSGYQSYMYELLQYTTDNCVPFSYSGSMVSNSQATACEITLNTLILPNTELVNGGKIWSFPYVYVELENVSTSSSGNRNIIYSNNPNSYKAVFKVPLQNISNPEQYEFLNLNGSGVKQVITFKLNADVKITIRLPNGTVFQTQTVDFSNGRYPNPLIQISALFGIEKI